MATARDELLFHTRHKGPLKDTLRNAKRSKSRTVPRTPHVSAAAESNGGATAGAHTAAGAPGASRRPRPVSGEQRQARRHTATKGARNDDRVLSRTAGTVPAAAGGAAAGAGRRRPKSGSATALRRHRAARMAAASESVNALVSSPVSVKGSRPRTAGAAPSASRRHPAGVTFSDSMLSASDARGATDDAGAISPPAASSPSPAAARHRQAIHSAASSPLHVRVLSASAAAAAAAAEAAAADPADNPDDVPTHQVWGPPPSVGRLFTGNHLQTLQQYGYKNKQSAMERLQDIADHGWSPSPPVRTTGGQLRHRMDPSEREQELKERSAAAAAVAASSVEAVYGVAACALTRSRTPAHVLGFGFATQPCRPITHAARSC